MAAKTLMVQGTTSDAGKTTLVAALCRVYARQGLHVAPFKPQNMALNSAVTPDGGEIGRAQAVQAHAANVPLSVDFNPILLKPQSDKNAQVIIHGQVFDNMNADQYHDYKKIAFNAVMASHARLEKSFSRIVVEGAGSPAEINLREGDIANMGFAEAADCPVIIIADIDKGGVFAHLVGTLALLSESEQQRVIGFVINRFRGDISLLEPGLTWLENYTDKPVLGVLPYIHGLHIAAEDAVSNIQDIENTKLKVIVPVTPRMSNHNDFDALRIHPEIDLTFVYASEIAKTPLPEADLIILAGSKNTREDLAFIKNQGWDRQINKHLRYGGKLFGICGGFQMLGHKINDPLGLEGKAGSSEGLGLLPIVTTLQRRKTLANQQAILHLAGEDKIIEGYEIHLGETTYLTDLPALMTINDEPQGLISDDQQIAGGYLHGIWDSKNAIEQLASWCQVTISEATSLDEIQEHAIERLADTCEQYLALDKIETALIHWRQHNE
ncbi:cobyric acid synthase [Thalassotalea sp. PP2-459]|uniref:cobyric acid synthase n=1 Tax=Thalassotalea sp. PP2-459 TaxID=1742724 RepID=UPI000942D330|nr:cobyric acid synthase [Thalassotalea sp. PP2-459]OKY26161.1 cobyric acid synthase CobQ [Thalassotalea sp. PP2-459]